MTVDLRFLSKNSSFFVILPLDGDFIIELKHVPNSALKLYVYLQRLGLPALKVSLRERIGKLLDLLKKETIQRNVILDKIKNGPIPFDKVLKICHGSADNVPVGVEFFFKYCQDFMVFKFCGVTYVSCRDVEHLTLALDSESFGSLDQQEDEEFIIGRIKFILTHQLTSISIDELQYLRMGQVTVDENLLIKHADVLDFTVLPGSKTEVRLKEQNVHSRNPMKPLDPLSRKDKRNSKSTQLSRSADNSSCLSKSSALGEEVEMSENYDLEEPSQEEGMCELTARSYSIDRRELLPQKCSRETIIKKEHKNMGNEKSFLTMVISVLLSINKPVTVSYLSSLIEKWENMTISLRFISKNSSLFVVHPLDRDLIIQLKDSPEPGEKRDACVRGYGLPKLTGASRNHVGKIACLLQKEMQARKTLMLNMSNFYVPAAQALNPCQQNASLNGVEFFLKHVEHFRLLAHSGETFVSRRDAKDLLLLADSDSDRYFDSQTDEEFIVERIKFILTEQLTCGVPIKELHYLRMGNCIVDGALIKRHANLFWVKDDIIFLK